MSNSIFYYRTEDIDPEQIKKIFIETEIDRENINFLKSNTPGLLVGSRGTGKTMLLKVAETELDDSFKQERNLAVFISFSTAMFVKSTEESYYFRQWMLAKVLFALKRKLKKMNLIVPKGVFTEYFDIKDEDILVDKIDELRKVFEQSWYKKNDDILKQANSIINIEESNAITDVDYFKGLIEDICNTCDISRITLFFDEACHNFIPIEQREFFTLFRDLRCNKICCKAAVYPGITSYGTIQKFHDVTLKKVERDITSKDYIEKMRSLVKNQVDEQFYKILENNGDNFDALIYCSSGNPRLLLKSIAISSEEFKSLKKQNVVRTMKEFYRTTIWNEHTKLAEMYEGHKGLIDWGRTFIENEVLKSTWEKNSRILKEEDKTQTLFFAIHKDAPPTVKNAIRIFEYLGIVSIHTEGTKVRKEIFDRYQINFGVVLASEPDTKEYKLDPIIRYKQIIESLSVKLYTDYGKSSPAYAGSEELITQFKDIENNSILEKIMKLSIRNLELSDFLLETIEGIGILTIEDVLTNGEDNLKRAKGIGDARARKIFKIAYNATMEYISG